MVYVIVLVVAAVLVVLAAVLLVIWRMLVNEGAGKPAIDSAPAQVRPQTEDRFAAMRKEELLSAFAVADDEPLLEALVHVLHAMEIERGDNAAESDLPAEVAKGYAMAQGALKEAQEEVLRWVDEANRARSGGGDAG